jgi:DNA polymerase I
MTKRTILLDGDVLAFRATWACEEAICWDEKVDLWTLHADVQKARQVWQDQLDWYLESCEADKFRIAFSHPNRFRNDLVPSYKEHRAPTRKPTVYPELVSWVKRKYGRRVRCYPRLEGDDVLGIIATSREIRGEHVIVTIDKDLKQIPGLLWNPDKPELGLEEVTPEQGRRWHLVQTLTGDKVDGFDGCPGIGPVRAEKILQEGTWDEVVAAFAAKNLSEEFALLQARLAKILEWGMYHRGRVKLWTPSKTEVAA